MKKFKGLSKFFVESKFGRFFSIAFFTLVFLFILGFISLFFVDKVILNYAKELLEMVGLKDRIYHYPDQLSGGERQRVAVARAIIHKPLVIFADEPTGSLDRKNAENVAKILWDLKKEFHITLVVATHSKEIASMCDRIIEM
jgi:predicted ABC-type transport system involved in lysophospholipase L1 biosynthesis ATPase subunit